MTFFFYISVVAGSLAATGLGARAAPSPSPSFSNAMIGQIRANAHKASNQSWELGTYIDAITIQDAYHLTAFGADKLPIKASAGSLPKDALSIIDGVLAAKWPGLKPFMQNGAAADPASIGVGANLAAITTGNSKYADAAASQLDYLLHDVPRDTDNITISHRNEKEPFQAWADFMYMVPPFLADYAVVSGGDYGAGLIAFAFSQCQNYRTILQDPDTKLWRHIMKGKWNDTGSWASGNGWAAMGMLRVEATIAKSEYAWNMKSEVADLRRWTGEILNAAWSRQEASGLVKNYMDQNSFEDASGTALLAAATYRYSLITETTKYIPNAEKAFRRLIELTNNGGWLQSVVNPYNFGEISDKSPEAQSFLINLHVLSSKFYEWQQAPNRVLGNALVTGINRSQNKAGRRRLHSHH